MLRAITILAFATIMSGCTATTVSESSLQQLRARNVSAKTLSKFERGSMLTLPEIKELGRKGVSDRTVLTHLRRTDGVYRLNSQDVTALRNAGVGDEVINYLLRTPEINEMRRNFYRDHFYPGSYYGYPYYPYQPLYRRRYGPPFVYGPRIYY